MRTMRLALLALGLAAAAAPALAQEPPGPTVVLEIRGYNLRPGQREAFHALFVRESLPLLRARGVDVVAFGPSSHDRDSYFLMRAFASLDDRTREEDAFYGSEAWIQGPRAAVLAAIESYTTITIHVDPATLQGLRHAMSSTIPSSTAPSSTTMSSDLDTLVRLNADYIESVRTSNVRRFDEILAADFLCTQSDGTLLDRAQFLEHTARPFTLKNLEAHDVNVRLFGDTAIVHARTTYALPGGTPGSGRYTDVWVKRDGQWRAVAAHVTRR